MCARVSVVVSLSMSVSVSVSVFVSVFVRGCVDAWVRVCVCVVCRVCVVVCVCVCVCNAVRAVAPRNQRKCCPFDVDENNPREATKQQRRRIAQCLSPISRDPFATYLLLPQHAANTLETLPCRNCAPKSYTAPNPRNKTLRISNRYGLLTCLGNPNMEPTGGVPRHDRNLLAHTFNRTKTRHPVIVFAHMRRHKQQSLHTSIDSKRDLDIH